MQARKACHISLSGEHDRTLSAQLSTRRNQAPGLELGHRRLFIDDSAARLDRSRQAAHQARRMQACSITGKQSAMDIGYTNAFRGLLRR